MGVPEDKTEHLGALGGSRAPPVQAWLCPRNSSQWSPLNVTTLMFIRDTHADVNFPCCLPQGNPILLLTIAWLLLQATSLGT